MSSETLISLESLDHNRRLVKDLFSSHIPPGIYVSSCSLLDCLRVLFRRFGEDLGEPPIYIHGSYVKFYIWIQKKLRAPCSVNKKISEMSYLSVCVVSKNGIPNDLPHSSKYGCGR